MAPADTFADLIITGCSSLRPPVGGALKPERWAHQPARLARMDRLCGLALVAADAALLDAAVAPSSPTWGGGERVGVVVGTAHGCHATNQEYFRGLVDGGPRTASPRLFAYTLPSSPLGEVSIHYGARGPSETLASGRHSGLEAVGWAAALLAERADLVLVIAVDSAGASLVEMGLRSVDAAAALVLERGDAARARGARVRGRLVAAAAAFDGDSPEGAAQRAADRAAVGAAGEALQTLSVDDSDDAVAPLAAIVQWLTGARAGALALARAQDPGGGAAALLVAG